MFKYCWFIFITPLILILAACNSASGSPAVKERLLVWHNWPDADAAGLQTLINDFTALNPDTKVIVVDLTTDKLGAEVETGNSGENANKLLLRRFREQAELGFGPDLLIGSSDWVRDLVDAGLIQGLSSRVGEDTLNYLSTALDTVRYQPPGQSSADLYGLPLTLDTVAMYYNKKLVTDPAKTLDILTLQAREGKKVGLDIRFDQAFWGVKGFGGRLFDESGRVVLDQGGFANWLSWLKNTQNEPNFILDNDEATLAALFKAGNLAYFVGSRALLPGLSAALGADAVGVVPMPQGPNAAAGPFLRTQSLMINTYSSSAQTETAFRLAKFLTNTEQQTKLVRQTGRVPANIRARVDPQVYPLVASFLTQAKTAVPVLNTPQMETVLKYGDETYLKTLTGEIEPNDAARDLTNRVNREYGTEPLPQKPAVTCALTGTLEVWHRWGEAPEAPVLQQITDEFSAGCPDVSVNLTAFDTETLFNRYQAATANNTGPDIIIGPNLWIVPWAEKKLIGRLDGAIQPELLQQYTSLAKIAMQDNEGLFGLPLSQELMALYYRTDRVTDPPGVVDDLLNQATPEQQVALPISFYHASWGSLAFGSVTYDADYQPEFNPAGFEDWLNWLKKAQAQPGVALSPDPAELQLLFVSGKATYYAGDASELYALQQALGKDQIRVVRFPSGPVDESRPQLTVEGVMINSATLADEPQAALALQFAVHLTNLDSQTRLMAQASRVPSLVNADTAAYPAIAGFLEQAKTAVPLINTPEELQLQQVIDEVYTQVIFGDADPTEAVGAAVEQLTQGSN